MNPYRFFGATLFGAAAASASVLVLWAGSAGADGPQLQQAGWWTQLNPGMSGIASPIAPVPPDVPSNGLLVESDLNGSPLAYAGLVFQLPQDSAPGKLSLTIAPNSATTPDSTLEVCPLVNPALRSEQGGPTTDAPAYACPSTPITATPDATGTTYQFDVSGLASDGSLAVAILPTSSTDRVVFDAPQGSWLALTQQSTTPATTANSGSGSVAPSATAPPTVFPPISSTFSPMIDQTPVVSPTPAPPAVTSPQPQSPSVPSSPQESLGAFSSFGSFGPAKPLVTALVILGLVGGAGLWFYAGRRRPDEVAP